MQPSPAGSSCQRMKAPSTTRSITIDANQLEPMITFGTNPGMGMPISGVIPNPADVTDSLERDSLKKALQYMNLEAGKPLIGQAVNVVFVGSCTNSRMSDLRAAASVMKGRKVAPGVRMMVVPGSQIIKRQAEAEGLDQIFKRCRRRLARSRLLDVHRDERRSVEPR
jgi:3-isopropylmalate/(R)-2-methylmalate dehydratase large subunit